jgi:hypothetical protein
MCQVYRRDEEEEKEEPEVRSSGADTWSARWHRFAVIFLAILSTSKASGEGF